MDYLPKEILELKEVTRDFTDREVVPMAQQMHLDDKEIPDTLLAKMREMGFFGVYGSPEHGGLGLGALAIAVVTEELSRGSMSVGSLPARNWALARVMEEHGTEAQKKNILPKLLSGELQSAHAGTEPQAGSDAGNIKTKAVASGDVYRLTGSKQWCTNAGRADLLSVFCRTSDSKKHGGISQVMVMKPRGEFLPPTLTGSRIVTLGYKGMNTYSLFFDEHEVPRENLVGGSEGQAFKHLMSAYELIRMQFAFRCIGLSQAAYESALAYSRDRVQFGQPICNFQAIRHKLADMATQIEAARQLGYMVARKIDAGLRTDLEAGMVKLFASEMTHHICHDAVQIHGGNGFAVEQPVNRYLRDSVLCTIGEGTSEIQREVIARRILGER